MIKFATFGIKVTAGKRQDVYMITQMKLARITFSMANVVTYGVTKDTELSVSIGQKDSVIEKTNVIFSMIPNKEQVKPDIKTTKIEVPQ